MQLYQVDDHGQLFISPAITDWKFVEALGIDTVLDMEGGLDDCIPTHPAGVLYVYFPIYDEDLPNLVRLEAIAQLGAHVIRAGHKVLSHCGMGFNRSALVAGRILHLLGMPGEEILTRMRARRPGALFNDVFAEHIRGLR